MPATSGEGDGQLVCYGSRLQALQANTTPLFFFSDGPFSGCPRVPELRSLGLQTAKLPATYGYGVSMPPASWGVDHAAAGRLD